MDFENEKARLLFLRYAVPCAETLVERGLIHKKLVKRMINDVTSTKLAEDYEKNFTTAISMCGKIAKRNGKKFIDEKVIRRYFLFEHDKTVDKRYGVFKDFDPMSCRVYSGKVLKLKNGKVTVQTIIGKKKYSTALLPKIKKGDCVSTHRDFVVEKITEKLAKSLWVLKENYFKSNKIKIFK